MDQVYYYDLLGTSQMRYPFKQRHLNSATKYTIYRQDNYIHGNYPNIIFTATELHILTFPTRPNLDNSESVKDHAQMCGSSGQENAPRCALHHMAPAEAATKPSDTTHLFRPFPPWKRPTASRGTSRNPVTCLSGHCCPPKDKRRRRRL